MLLLLIHVQNPANVRVFIQDIQKISTYVLVQLVWVYLVHVEVLITFYLLARCGVCAGGIDNTHVSTAGAFVHLLFDILSGDSGDVNVQVLGPIENQHHSIILA